MNTKKLLARIFGAVVLLLILVMILPTLTSPTVPGAMLKRLPFGWWEFLRRNVPHLTWNWGLIATGIFCSVVIVLLAHGLLGFLCRQIQASLRPERPLRPWLWRWTLGLYAAVWLLFAIAFGAAGVLRHASWLLAYDQPWFQPRDNIYVNLRTADMDIRTLLLDCDENVDAARREFPQQPSYRHRRTLVAEEFDLIFYGDRSNHVAAYVVIPRRKQSTSSGQFLVSIGENSDLFRPLTDLQRTIAELDAAYPPPAAR